ncbi:HNH endonuclease signature motif containing protein [Acinetobacter sp.]|uniref:HNH endonuclease signature motif containing protein n=1 Tax=Acinetobacter sp. TaxID=472 RepID=UPI003750F550
MPRHHYTKELLEPIVKDSKAWSEVCRKLGIKPATGAQTHVKKRAGLFGITHEHFAGNAWNKGRTFAPKQKIETYLIKNSTLGSHKLKLRLIKDGLKEAKCEICELTHWRDEPIVLELDHKDSDHFNNEIENLQILCPNCHAQLTRQRIKLAGVMKR